MSTKVFDPVRTADEAGPRSVPPGFSIYLDLLRVLAAVGVVLYHVKTLEIGPVGVRQAMPGFGHEFVVVFFVLSGYVIASTVARRSEATLMDYGIDRVSRIYSVALSALVVSAGASWALNLWGGESLEGSGSSADILTSLLLNLVMLGQSWAWDSFPPSNPPFWSLCYEFFYYALFGCAIYLRGWRRWLGLAVISAIAGPKILLLMPCWLLGVALFKASASPVRSRWQFLLIAWIVPSALFALMSHFKVGRTIVEAVSAIPVVHAFDLARSDTFAKDYVTALLVALHLYGVRQLSLRWRPGVAAMIRRVAGLTFTLYLLHYPTLLIVKAAMGDNEQSGLALAVAVTAVTLSTVAIGALTELRLPQFRVLVRRVASRLGHVTQVPAAPVHPVR